MWYLDFGRIETIMRMESTFTTTHFIMRPTTRRPSLHVDTPAVEKFVKPKGISAEPRKTERFARQKFFSMRPPYESTRYCQHCGKRQSRLISIRVLDADGYMSERAKGVVEKTLRLHTENVLLGWFVNPIESWKYLSTVTVDCSNCLVSRHDEKVEILAYSRVKLLWDRLKAFFGFVRFEG